MPYDIYGGNLRPGHCEVHPWVHESYPCSLCFAESKSNKEPYDGYDGKAEQEYYEQMERDHYEGLVKKHSLKYRITLWVASILHKANDRAQKYKENLLIRKIQEGSWMRN